MLSDFFVRRVFTTKTTEFFQLVTRLLLSFVSGRHVVSAFAIITRQRDNISGHKTLSHAKRKWGEADDRN